MPAALRVALRITGQQPYKLGVGVESVVGGCVGGGRVADDDCGAVDSDALKVCRSTHPSLGFRLGRLVVVAKRLPGRVVLSDRTGLFPADVGGRDVMERG